MPGDVRLAHGPDESVEVDEIVRVAETLVLATLRACGTLDRDPPAVSRRTWVGEELRRVAR
jgi:hypothetical protein